MGNFSNKLFQKESSDFSPILIENIAIFLLEHPCQVSFCFRNAQLPHFMVHCLIMSGVFQTIQSYHISRQADILMLLHFFCIFSQFSRDKTPVVYMSRNTWLHQGMNVWGKYTVYTVLVSEQLTLLKIQGVIFNDIFVLRTQCTVALLTKPISVRPIPSYPQLLLFQKG